MRIKSILNKLIDEAVHPRGTKKTLETIITDEILHILVEGEFKPDKFVRYQIVPLLKPKKPKKRRKKRRRT